MTLKATRLLLTVAAVTLLVCLLVKMNPTPATLRYGWAANSEISAPLGLLVFLAFLTGGILLGFIYSIGNIALRLKIKSLQTEETKLLSSWNTLRQINGLISIGELETAERELHSELKGKQKITEFRVLLAKVKTALGKDREAMLVLDGIRADELVDAEVLWLIADLQRRAGNRTAEVDFLSRILTDSPRSKTALERAVAALVELKDFARAIGYQKTRCEICSSEHDLERQQLLLAEFELRKISQLSLSPTDKANQLQQLLKDHRDFPPALLELARVKVSSGDPDAANRLFYRAFVSHPKIDPLNELSTMWLRLNKPDEALAAVRSCIAKAPQYLQGKIFLAALLMRLESWQEAKKELRVALNAGEPSGTDQRLAKLLYDICAERLTPSPKGVQTLLSSLTEFSGRREIGLLSEQKL